MNNQDMNNNQVVENKNHRYIDPKTGSGYVSASDNNMDFSIAFVVALILIVIVGGGLLLFTNSDVKEIIDNEIQDIKETIGEFFDEIFFVNEYDPSVFDDDDEYSDEESGNEELEDEEDMKKGYDTNAFVKVYPSSLENLSKYNTIVVWIGRQTCGYCAKYAPVLETIKNEYNIPIYYIDLATMINFDASQPYITNQYQFDIIGNIPGEGEWDGFADENIGATPLTLIMRDGKVIGGVSGYVDNAELDTVFNVAGVRKR